MKLTKQLEKEIMHVHEAYWDGYLKGDVPSMTALLDEHYTQVGSAEGEEFSNKKDAVQFLHDTIDQVAGKLEMRNRVTKLEVESKTRGVSEDTPYLVSERADIYVLDGKEWIFYSKFRASTLLQKSGKEWKIIHQHSSFPDTRAEEGQNIATEKIAAENLQLREAVKRRTIELEQKSRELEIEASLERVRAMALSMRKPDDLPGICEVLFTELKQLGFSEIRNAMINIHDDDKGTFINYDYSDEIGKSINHLHYNIHPLIEKQIKQIRSAGDAFSETSFSGKDLKEWKKFRKKIGEKDDPRIKDIDALHYYFYSIGTGSIGISTFSAITDEKRNVLKRFRNVFDFSYRRYLDVSLAETQAKEAKIEASLERVRAHAMSMMKSGELLIVCESVFNELQVLGFTANELRNAQIVINNDEKGMYYGYQYSDYIGGEIAEVPYDMHPTIRSLNTTLRGSVDAFADIEISGKALEDWKDFVNSFPQKRDDKLNAATELHYYFYSVGLGALGISTFQSLPQEKLNILQRLRNVFNLSYQRYIDIAQAEAQAKEAQIEVALERVRARAMAMHASSELIDVANVLRDQMGLLGQHQIETMAIHLYKDGENEFDSWYAGRDQSGKLVSGTTRFKKDSCWLLREALAGYHSPQHEYDIEASGDKLKEWQHVLVAAVPEYESMVNDFPEKSYYHITDFSGGSMIMVAYQPPTDETKALQKRCSNVFDLAYKRFVDIKQAEAQTREAQIELALERVRARTMAMHKSREVMDVAVTLYDELQKLDFNFGAATIIIIDKVTGHMEHWLAGFIQKNHVESYPVYNIDHPIHAAQLSAWRKGENFTSIELSGKALKAYAEEMFLHSGYKNLPDEEKALLLENEHAVFNMAYMKHGALMWAPSALTDEKATILQRFAKVFEQTYTRFLDLQKAEAQAREAQIEASLERVRSSSLAMHRSDELQGVVNTVIEQLKELNIELDTTNILIFNNDSKSIEFWTGSNSTGKQLTSSWQVPYTEYILLKEMHQALQNGQEVFLRYLSFEEKNTFFNYLFTKSDFKHLNDERKKFIFESERASILGALVKDVGIQIISYSRKSFLSEEIEILKRFSKVFEQAHTRFLDLQKAETQAREAQIEVAVERVRAQSMAMHQTSDLDKVNKELLNQLHWLNVNGLTGVSIWLIDENEQASVWDLSSPGNIGDPNSATVKYDPKKYPILGEPLHFFKNSLDYFTLDYPIARLEKAVEEWREVDNNIANAIEEAIKNGNLKHQWNAFGRLSNGLLSIDLMTPPSDDTKTIVLKIAGAFNLAYKRFLDLQKAEAQAREAKIEAALEKIRSRSLAMHQSNELKDVIAVVFEKLNELELIFDGAGIYLFKDNSKDLVLWVMAKIESNPERINLPYDKEDLQNSEFFNNLWTARKTGEVIYNWTYSFDEKNKYFLYVFKYNTQIPFSTRELLLQSPGYTHSVIMETNSALMADSWSGKTFSIDELNVLKRVAKVFEQAYTRFLDLQKAETQAREAKIEAALERTRTQSMIMQRSNELDNTLRVFHEQVLLLGIHSAFSFLWLPDEVNDRHIFWAVWAEKSLTDTLEKTSSTIFKSKAINYPMDRNEPATAQCLIDWKGKEPVVSYQVPPAGVEAYFAAWQELIEGVDQLKPAFFSNGLYYVEAFMKYGCFGVMTAADLAEEEKKILGRVAIEFERTYTRFLDLQKAESQAREAQIETALERVRSRTMAMQHSNELAQASNLLFQQVQALNIPVWSCGYNIWEEGDSYCIGWMSSNDILQPPFRIPLTDSPSFIKQYESRKRGEVLYTEFVEGQALVDHYNYMASLPDFKPILEHFIRSGYQLPQSQFNHVVNFAHGNLIFISGEAIPDVHDIFKRFAKVFEQTYTRFLDLQKAEASAREAQIETALERVRSRSMGMQKSEELKQVIQVVYDQFVHLNINIGHTGFVVDYKIRDDYNIWIADPLGVPSQIIIPYFDCIYYNRFNEAKKNGENFFATNLSFEEKNKFYQKLFQHIPDLPEEAKNFYFSCPGLAASTVLLDNVCLYIENFSGIPYTDEENNTLMRFGKVFQQTYTRFLDLQKAEELTREAIKRASVDRVRAEIASMRTTHDLERIIPLIWSELTTLGVPFIRCGVFIVDEAQKQVQTLLSTPEGKAIASFQLLFENTEPLPELLPHWQRKEIYKLHWDEAAFIASTKILMQRGAITENNQDQYTTEHRPTNLNLHFLPFLQGMLYVGSDVPLSDDEVQLAQNLADAFSTAYARYEDFNKLEAANNKIEKTLVDLRQTQSQLVQSEKMASLGELTAGIAHEIQNPLNFVNNFSEVNRELITEMNDEILKGNYDEVKAIAKDITENEEKINHHGKRAESIVKGMLQHSRKSTGVKEPTDINALADEYMRLSYHGLRAKDKSFNAEFKMDLDQTLPLVKVIPQDIGRVLLNLFNNAFWAVNERQQDLNKRNAVDRIQSDNNQALGSPEFVSNSGEKISAYSPVVTLTTKNLVDQSDSYLSADRQDRIEIRIHDNGPGIPPHIIDKIFQPFFTTKPTGQGTGLGLSLAYDIIKAHQGELTVETKMSEGLDAGAPAPASRSRTEGRQAGTTFIIQLPAN